MRIRCNAAARPSKYSRVGTDEIAFLDNGEAFQPVATLANSDGGRCQISVDDGCYVVSLRRANGRYSVTPWIFPEAWQVLKILPEPSTYPNKEDLCL